MPIEFIAAFAGLDDESGDREVEQRLDHPVEVLDSKSRLAYQEALILTDNQAERDYLVARMAALP